LLEDMGIKVYWANDEDSSENEFQTFNITKKRQNMFGKPCFKQGEEIILQGLKYQLVSTEATEDDENTK